MKMGKRDGHFTKDNDTDGKKVYEKVHDIIVTRELYIKATRCHYMPIRTANLKTDSTNTTSEAFSFVAG